jgi:hypothetical protein
VTARANPFPAYPVAALEPDREESERLTVTTPGIAKAEILVAAYFEQLTMESLPHGLNASVAGEFGTGKTHLLAHVRHRFLAQATELGLSPSVAGVGAMESTPIEWYQSAIGPQLAGLDLEGLAIDLYAHAAKTVALRTPLTSSAAAHLDEDSANVKALMRDELLSSTSVELELIATLERIAPKVHPQALKAVEGLIRQPRPSLRWLEGGRLSEREVVDSGLSEQLDSDTLAADAIVAIAAIHRFLARPFLLLVDELEHFVRRDFSAGGKSNVTWFKRLLERLESCGAFVIVAGHSSAWEGHPDYLDRFSPDAAVQLAPVTAADVAHIVERFEGDRGAFDEGDAALVAELTDGNVRRVLGMLHELHRRSEGFESPLSEETIVSVATASSREIDPEQALATLDEVLSTMGLQVSRRTAIAGLSFDLVGYQGESPAVVVEVKRALFGKKQQEQAQRFLDKLRVVNRDAPACIGVFASEGVLDPALLEVNSSAAQVFWFDLTQPGFAADVRHSLEPALQAVPPSASAGSGLQRDAALAELNDRIQEIKDIQAAEYARLEGRLKAPSTPASELEFRAPSSAETRDERRPVFEDLAKSPRLLRQLSLIPGSRLVSVGLLAVLGIGAIALAAPLSETYANSQGSYALIRVLLYLGGATAILASLLIVVRQFLLLDRFYSFKRERLRDVYVLDAPTSALVETSRIVDRALDQCGPRYAVVEASRALSKASLLRVRTEMGIDELDN